MDNGDSERKSGELTVRVKAGGFLFLPQMPYDKHGYAKRSKNPREYRVRDEFGKIIAYGHTPEEAVRKAKKKQNPFGFDVSELL